MKKLGSWLMVDNLVDIQLERQILASILEDGTLVDTLFETADETLFTDKIARKTFKWIKNQYMKNERISQVTMEKESNINIEELIKYGTREFEFEDSLNILEKLKIRRQLIKDAKKIYNLAKNNNLNKSEYKHLEQEIVFKDADFNKDNDIFDMQQTLEKAYEEIVKILNGENNISGIPTGYPSIDTATGGLHREHLIVVAGPTSMGKSAFAINIAYNVLKQAGKVIYISLEMPVKDIGKKLLSLDSLIPLSRYKKKLMKFEKDNIDASLSRLMNKNWRLCTERGLTTADIRAICRKLTREMEGVDLIIIDYLQNIKERSGNHNRARKVGMDCKDLYFMAGELDVPVILLSQVSRKRNGQPKISDLRGSGEIEETADEIWFPFRPKYDDKVNNNKETEPAKIIFGKGRNSGTGVVDFIWYPKILHWRDAFIEKTEGPLELIEREES